MPKVSIITPVYNVEPYLDRMLRSLQAQTLRDFEVLMIDDGSSDGSAAILERFAAEDARFRLYTQTNSGVAAARNRGISLATGEYIVFYDPDDEVPPHALETMYRTAHRRQADMVVGVMVEKNLGETLIYEDAQKLAQQRDIDPLDEHFFRAWSLCHKMFSQRLIREHGLQLEPLSNAEDGVFTFAALNHARRICGCNVVAYRYLKRPFWQGASATQIISASYLDGLLAAHDRILEEAEHLAAYPHRCTADSASEDISTTASAGNGDLQTYLEPLYVRFIEGEMLNGYYRNIWRAEEDLLPAIRERTAQYRAQISASAWRDILWRHRDIGLEEGFLEPGEMLARPRVSILVDPEICERMAEATGEDPAIGTKCGFKRFNRMLRSLYYQRFPLFELLVPATLERNTARDLRAMPNLRFVAAGTLEQEAKGAYLLYLDAFVLFTKNTLRQLVLALDDQPSLDYASILMKHWNGREAKPMAVLSASYPCMAGIWTGRHRSAMWDSFLCNKLFRRRSLGVSSLERIAALTDAYSGQAADFVYELCRTRQGKRLRKGALLTNLREGSFVQRCEGRSIPRSLDIQALANEAAAQGIERLKRHITREDLEKLKRRWGRR